MIIFYIILIVQPKRFTLFELNENQRCTASFCEVDTTKHTVLHARLVRTERMTNKVILETSLNGENLPFVALCPIHNSISPGSYFVGFCYLGQSFSKFALVA